MIVRTVLIAQALSLASVVAQVSTPTASSALVIAERASNESTLTLQLANQTSSVITGWTIRIDARNARGQIRTSYMSTDRFRAKALASAGFDVPADWKPLYPNAVTTVTINIDPRFPEVAPAVVAVLFDDRSSVGQPDQIRAALAKREAAAAAIDTWLPVLLRAQAGANLQQMAAVIAQQRTAAKTQRPNDEIPALLDQLNTSGGSEATYRQRLQRLIQYLTGLKAEATRHLG